MGLMRMPEISEDNAFTPRQAMSTSISSSKTLSSSLSSRASGNWKLAPISDFSGPAVEETLRNAESVIKKWDLNSKTPYTQVASLFVHDREEAKSFLKSANDLREAMHFLVTNHSSSDKLVLAQSLTQIAMKRLEKELYHILSTNREHLDPESVSRKSSRHSDNSENENGIVSDDEMVKVSESTMEDVKSVVDCMISAGYGTECIKIYKLMRKSAVDEGIYRLGIERIKSSQIQKLTWSSREHLIKNWLNAVKVAVQTLFKGERILCDHVFSASSKIRESCFAEITKEAAINLFRLPEIMARIKGSPHRIFKLIELYEATYELWPDIESIFKFDSMLAVKLQALSTLVKLGNMVQVILSNYEATIQKDSSKILPEGGGIHTLTQSVMEFTTSLTNYSATLSDILTDHPRAGNLNLPASYFDGPSSGDLPTSPVLVRLALLILVLQCKLDAKAELYKDVSLSYLFLANNLNYIVEKVRSTNLKYLLGDEWVATHAEKVTQYAASYEAAAWSKVLSSLPEAAAKEGSPAMSPDAVRACLQRFGAAFEEEYRKQTSWTVPDGKLRDEIKVSISRKLVPAYGQFCEACLGIASGDGEAERKLASFGADDLGNYLSDLFHGKAVSRGSSQSLSWRSRGCLLR
ncbi:exocyst complex component EXO70H1 [Rhodamnia argentea]|uniref:Exocyst subunit Exo70 family protein n=1 Tax=Rhodamnia argentea TaxID=178133 RepID=A0A8B8QIB5_9MYRT|nr:exocyst complex component EXO70H1 [Rhodamnia argentea]